MTPRPVVNKGNLEKLEDDTQFKKSHQTVDRPPVTDHNINDEYVKNSPNNLAPNSKVSNQNQQTPGKKEGAYEPEPADEGVLGDQGLGRAKKDTLMAEALNEPGDSEITR